MTDTTATDAPLPFYSVEAVADGRARLGELLAGLRAAAPSVDGQPRTETRFENHLALVRLGIATSLFYALRAKHAPTAAHCLRVALSCSAWAERLGLEDTTRDRIEVAALLHDLGKIGIPDRILRKPGKLTTEEQLVMDRCPRLGCEILRGCTSDPELLQIVYHASTWFESRREEDSPQRDALPLGARMLAIADAFDAMTTDTVYRRAMSRERAIQELIDGSCTQFDPELALDFNRMLELRPEMLHGAVVHRWLQQLHHDGDQGVWGVSPESTRSIAAGPHRESLFCSHLIGSLKDGVAFTDAEGTITQWSPGMQSLTSITAEAILGQTWSNESIGLLERGKSAHKDPCLVKVCLDTSSVVAQPMLVRRAQGDPMPVHVQVSPVFGPKPGIHGTVILVRDLSDQANLEEQLESLHRKSTRDPLTGVFNRAHFDSTLASLAREASKGGPSFSLIICDIDHFKRVNDLHGHPAGDEALVRFAGLLSSHSRDEDLVARYGGEEFLVLAPNCDNATAARRAEAIRIALESTSLPSLGGETVTASFGVTEFQAGDTGETILARADRALLKAKDNGRNRVIQLGSGNRVDLSGESDRRRWLGWFHSDACQPQREFDVITPVPLDLAIEKLRGFIADHDAEIISVRENHVCIKLQAPFNPGGRRRADRQISVRVQMTLSEVRNGVPSVQLPVKTNVHIELQAIRNRDRRNRELSSCFNRVVSSLRSYLMGEIKKSEEE
jgi:diguanylate cyclase (GGDEF)-like protein/PAS domain S-box-containing protein